MLTPMLESLPPRHLPAERRCPGRRVDFPPESPNVNVREGSRDVAGPMSGLRRGLQRIYGQRLRGVYLFGSRARGDGDLDSDLDVLVVLDRVDHYLIELDRTGELVSQISLAAGVALSRVFIPESEWLTGRSSFLENVREEAVPA